MSTTFILTSPNMTGAGYLQRSLAGGNHFRKNFRPGEIDGEYGPYTAAAVKRAKYWMGFPENQCTNVAGHTFVELLTGRRKLPPTYVARKNWRAKQAPKQQSIKQAALKEALSHDGYVETGNNNNAFGKWYGMNYAPWCAMFVTYCYIVAGSKSFKRGERWAYVPYVVTEAQQKDFGLSITPDPEPGDLVCFDWDGGVADHIGMFIKWTDRANGEFLAIEGNTAPTNNSNGGQVMRRTRRRSQVEAFVRVGS